MECPFQKRSQLIITFCLLSVPSHSAAFCPCPLLLLCCWEWACRDDDLSCGFVERQPALQTLPPVSLPWQHSTPLCHDSLYTSVHHGLCLTVLDSSCIQWRGDIVSKTWDMHVEHSQGTNCASCHRLWCTLARRKCHCNWLDEGKILKESMVKAWFQIVASSMNLANKPAMHVCVRPVRSWIAVCRAAHGTRSFKPTSETETDTLAACGIFVQVRNKTLFSIADCEWEPQQFVDTHMFPLMCWCLVFCVS